MQQIAGFHKNVIHNDNGNTFVQMVCKLESFVQNSGSDKLNHKQKHT